MTLLFPALLLVVLYFFMIVPQRKKQKAQQELLARIGPGDEVLTAGGIYGGVTEVDGNDLYLEIAPGVEIKVTKRSVADVVYRADTKADTKAVEKPAAEPAVPEPYEGDDTDDKPKKNKR